MKKISLRKWQGEIIGFGIMIWMFLTSASGVLALDNPPKLKDLEDLYKQRTVVPGFTGFRFAGATIGEVVSQLLPYVFVLAGVGVLFYLIYGGYHLMISQGDEKAMGEARGKITNAIIGFVVIFISYWIMQILGVILGLDRFGGLF